MTEDSGGFVVQIPKEIVDRYSLDETEDGDAVFWTDSREKPPFEPVEEF